MVCLIESSKSSKLENLSSVEGVKTSNTFSFIPNITHYKPNTPLVWRTIHSFYDTRGSWYTHTYLSAGMILLFRVESSSSRVRCLARGEGVVQIPAGLVLPEVLMGYIGVHHRGWGHGHRSSHGVMSWVVDEASVLDLVLILSTQTGNCFLHSFV